MTESIKSFADQEEESVWIADAYRVLEHIKGWLTEGGALPTLSYELSYPVLRMPWLSPVERLHARPTTLPGFRGNTSDDESMPAWIRTCHRIDWVTENGPTIDTPQPYSSRTHGTIRLMFLQLNTGGIGSGRMGIGIHGDWVMYVPPGSSVIAEHRLTPARTMTFDRLSYSEAASAIFAR